MQQQEELAQQILAVIALIPEGKVASYGQIARLAGLPRHARLVGRVLQHLDPSSEIPWYRVMNGQGRISLKKFNDQGENIQQLLLQAEGVAFLQDKVSLKQFQWQP